MQQISNVDVLWILHCRFIFNKVKKYLKEPGISCAERGILTWTGFSWKKNNEKEEQMKVECLYCVQQKFEKKRRDGEIGMLKFNEVQKKKSNYQESFRDQKCNTNFRHAYIERIFSKWRILMS